MIARRFTLIELMIVIALLALVIAIAVPSLLQARKMGNQSSAIASLKAIHTAQGLFRETDRDGSGENDYAPDLDTLGTYVSIDGVLATGTKQGYLFEIARNEDDAGVLWVGVANPLRVGATGDRHFALNQRGIIYYTGAGELLTAHFLDSCDVPATEGGAPPHAQNMLPVAN